MTIRAVSRAALVLSCLPLLYFGGASAAFVYRSKAANRACLAGPIEPPTSLTPDDAILVIAPHPDDETLACGGLLAAAVRGGCRVRVVFVTNGDGYRVGVERFKRMLDVTPPDFVAFGEYRQREAVRATAALGVSSSSLRFLGYPDGGLMQMWTSNWSRHAPVRSRHTNSTCSPYDDTYNRSAVYCGQNLLDDLVSVMRRMHPTVVYAPHASDDHPDHCATAAFATRAVQTVRASGQPWANRVALRHYLVHRGDWPSPQGLAIDKPLVPPADMADGDDLWRTSWIDGRDRAAKLRAIKRYGSQTAVMRRYLLSFARASEFSASSAEPAASDHPRSLAVLQDPVDDSLLRNLQSGSDIVAVTASAERPNLVIQVRTAGKIGPRTRSSVQIRYFGDHGTDSAGGFLRADSVGGRSTDPSVLSSSCDGSTIEMLVPRRLIAYCTDMAINVQTSASGVSVDRTGYRFVSLRP